VEGIVCWSPENSSRYHNNNIDIPFQDLQNMSMNSFLQRIRRKVTSMSTTIFDPVQDPNIDEFQRTYSEIYSSNCDFFRDRSDFVEWTSLSIEADLQHFSTNSIQDILKGKKPFKAMGMDNMPIELLKVSPNSASQLLSKMFSVFFKYQITPSIWRKSRLTTILKNGKDRRLVDSYRCISATSHVRKLYERCLKNILDKYKISKCHRLQFGFQKRTGCQEAIYVTSELLHHAQQHQRPLDMILLDVKKCFDRIRRDILWRKCEQRGASYHIIRVLQSLFEDCHTMFLIGNETSNEIYMGTGLMQGTILSPILCNILLDDLPERLIAASGFSVPMVGNLPTPVIMFADDHTLFFRGRQMGQKLINVCLEYGREHCIEYNTQKCLVVWSDPKCTWTMNIHWTPIPICNYATMLGIGIRNGKMDPDTSLTNRVAKARQSMNALSRMGLLSTHHISLARKRILIMTWVCAKYEYGLAFSQTSRSSMNTVNKLIRETVARCFKVKRSTRPMQRLMGMLPSEIRQSVLQINFRHKLVLLNHSTDRNSNHLSPSLVFTLKVLHQCSRHSSTIASSWSLDPSWSNFQLQSGMNNLLPLHRRQNQSELMKKVFSSKAWGTREQSKLTFVQLQEWDKPHVSAYFVSKEAIVCQRWIAGLLPSLVPAPCAGCHGNHLTSRYHTCICCPDTSQLIHPIYDVSSHLDFILYFDNPIDFMLQMQTPSNDFSIIESRLTLIGKAIQRIVDYCVPDLRSQFILTSDTDMEESPADDT
jgi:hypothetical protein